MYAEVKNGDVKRARLRHWELLVCAALACTLLSLVGLDTAKSQPPCINSSECDSVFATNTFNCTDGPGAELPSDCNYLCTNASDGTACATLNNNQCLHAVCSSGNCSVVEEFVPPSCMDDNPCTNNSCDVCANGCTGGCVITPVHNASICSLSLGALCMANGQCTSGSCADGVCCNTACDGALDSCNTPGFVGQCVGPAPAPAISWRGMLIVGFLLLAIGTFGVRALQRLPR